MSGAELTTKRAMELIHRLFPVARKREIGPNDSLFASGIVDSLGVLELVSVLEQEFSVTLQDDDLVPENFQTIGAIVAFMRRKTSCGPRVGGTDVPGEAPR
jgi:acyl carrier protein